MTDSEAATEALAIIESADGRYDESHKALDGLLCKVLEELGYLNLVKVFNESERWYE